MVQYNILRYNTVASIIFLHLLLFYLRHLYHSKRLFAFIRLKNFRIFLPSDKKIDDASFFSICIKEKNQKKKEKLPSFLPLSPIFVSPFLSLYPSKIGNKNLSANWIPPHRTRITASRRSSKFVRLNPCDNFLSALRFFFVDQNKKYAPTL